MDIQETSNSNEITIAEVIGSVGKGIQYITSQWGKLLLAGVIGLGIGIATAFIVPASYTAQTHFLVEEGKGGGGGGIAALAGQFGFDLGSLSGSSGLLSGDNVLIYLKSKSLIRETLLTPYDSAGTISLADRYVEIYDLKDGWEKDAGSATKLNFAVASSVPYSRLQDSLLHILTDKIIKKELSVEKPDKKASFVLVGAEMRDELLSKYFCERLVKKATERYVKAKTERQAINVARLQKRADSIGSLLNTRTYTSAAVQDQLIDINPGLKSPMARAEVSGRDKMMLATIYGEVIKNLEISKVALSQETPTIQIIDHPDLPLKKNKLSKLISGGLGGLIAVLLTTIYLLIRNFLKRQPSTT
jgi:hypothetical protein